MKSSVVLGEVVSLFPWSACPAQPLLWEPCIAATLGDHRLVIDIGGDSCHHMGCAVDTLTPTAFSPRAMVSSLLAYEDPT